METQTKEQHQQNQIKPKETTKKCEYCYNREYIPTAYYRHLKTVKHKRNINRKLKATNMLKDLGTISEKSHILFLEKLKTDIENFLNNYNI